MIPELDTFYAVAPVVNEVSTSDIGHAIAQSLSVGGVKGWILALVGGVLVAYLLKKAYSKMPDIIGAWFLSTIKKGLEAQGIHNGSFQLLVSELSLALVKYAERELPDKGMGPQRLALVEATLCRLPAVGMIFNWAINAARPEWEEMVDASVRKMDAIAQAEIAAADQRRIGGIPPAH